jgi:hypothetical protein
MSAIARLIRSTPWRRLGETLISRLSVWSPMLVALVPAQRAVAATLPEERGDVLYHLYDGGGQTVQGPAFLARANFADSFSVDAGYYIDQISGASIDVVTNASPYHEERREITAGTDYLYRDTLMSASYTDSNEHDYKARTYNFSVAQEMFENRTTLTLGFYQGNDQVGKSTEPGFHAKANRNGYNVSVAQVINPTFLATLSYELTVDDGYLQNPYRLVRVGGSHLPNQPEVDPTTRSGQAVSVRLVKSWSPRWSSNFFVRYYTDSWKIHAEQAEVGFSHYVYKDWILDGRYRFYVQQAASFYADNFPVQLDYMTRDKELAAFTSHTLGAKLTLPLYRTDPAHSSIINSITASAAVDYMMISYKDFTDARSGELYGFNATVAQLFFTFRY